MSLSLLLAFITTYFLIAMSPGLCMTLAMSLGISIGPRRTLWMVWGELAGVAIVGCAAVLGVAAVLMQAPLVFRVFRILGAGYLFMLGRQVWRSPAANSLQRTDAENLPSPRSLMTRGFVTVVSNPKVWAFFMTLLPPFVDRSRALAPQLALLLSMMLAIEFGCLMIYAFGGRVLAEWLFRKGEARWLNRATAVLMIALGFWLLLG